jgi:hypothetical protein
MILISAHTSAVAVDPEEEIRQLRQELQNYRTLLDAQQQRLDLLESAISALPKPSLRARGLGPSAAAGDTALKPPVSSAVVPPVGQPPDTSRAPDVPALVDIRGVLSARNTLTLEPSFQYSHSTNNRVAILGFAVIPAITIGLIDIRSVARDAFIGAISARYGVTNRFEVEAKVPWVYRKDATLSRPFASPAANDAQFDATGNGLGDIELSGRYQLNQPGPDRPYYVGAVRVKTRTGKGPFEVATETSNAQFLGLQRELPTGSGFYGVQPSLTAIFPSDPAVFFGNVSYLWNVKRNIGGNIGSIDPGDVAGFTIGMGLALNEKASFSIGYDHATVFRTRQNGVIIPNTSNLQLGSLLFGVSYKLTRKTVFSFTLGAGLTQEAPNVQLTFRLPTEM